MAIIYPETRRSDLQDPYAWLEQDSDERKSWVDAQHELTKEVFKLIPERERIQGRLEELVNREAIQAKCKGFGNVHSRKDTLFYAKRKIGEGQYSLYAMNLQTKQETLLLDLNKPELRGETSIARISPSPDGKAVLYELSRNGSAYVELQALDVLTGKVLASIPNTFYSNPVWMPDCSGFFYSKLISGIIPNQSVPRPHFHRIGEDPKEDKLVYDDKTPDGSWVWVTSVSFDGKKVIVHRMIDYSNTELLYLDLSKPEAKPESITGGERARFGADFIGDYLYVQTDYKAPNSMIGRIKLDGTTPKLKDLETVVEGGNGILTGFRAVGNLKYVTRRIDVSDRVFVLDEKGEREIELGEFRNTEFISGNEDNPVLISQSFLDPLTAYQVNGLKLEQVLKDGEGLDPNKFCVEQIWAKPDRRRDEEFDEPEIPMYVVRGKDAPIDGNNATILYAYGGFGSTIYPNFAKSRLLWLERGGIFVSANIRGGSEFGEKWHNEAKRDKKPNAVKDFSLCARALQGLRDSRKTGEEGYIARKYTKCGRLGITGESDGGLLTCAALVKEPEGLFSAVVSEFPFTDLARPNITPSGELWTKEYGDPRTADISYLLRISPYHNAQRIEGKRCPAVFIRVASGDDMVNLSHGMKMGAALQNYITSGGPILLDVKGEKSGHGGGESLQLAVEDLAKNYTFLAHFLGLKVF